MASNPVADVLRRAADRLQRNGWTRQMPLGRQGRRCCTLCAILDDSDLDLRGEAIALFQEHVGAAGSITDWNNQQRSKNAVLAALRAAADAAEGMAEK